MKDLTRRRAMVLAPSSLLATAVAGRSTAAVSKDTLAELAPSGRMKVAINLENPVLAQRDPTGGARGASVDIARELGRRLGVAVDLIVYETSRTVIAGQATDHWDVAFLARDPERAKVVDFTAPYVFIEGTYLVRGDAPFRSVADLDKPGLRIAVGRGAAYDLALTRQLQQATLVRAASSDAAITSFQTDGLDAAGGLRQTLVRAARETAGLRVLPDAFTRIEQGMVTPKGRPRAQAYLASFLEDLKATGFIRAALDRSGQTDAIVAGSAAPGSAAPLRAVYLKGNPVQAFPDPVTGELRGPAVDMAREIARQLHRSLDLIPGVGVEGVLSALREGKADIGFVAFDPTRAKGLAFTAPYVLSLNSFAVSAASTITTAKAVDRAGVRVAVNTGDAGGLYLQRTLKAATIQPITTPESGRDLLLAGKADVLGANRQRLSDLLAKDERFRLLPGNYFAVPQTVATREGDEGLHEQVSRSVENLLKTGFVARSIARAGLVGAQVAPAPKRRSSKTTGGV